MITTLLQGFQRIDRGDIAARQGAPNAVDLGGAFCRANFEEANIEEDVLNREANQGAQ